MRRAIRVICLASLAIFSLAAENWPQWRGPGLNGVSNEKDLPVRWGRDENVAWKLPLPSWSGATPIIWGDRIFLNVAEKEDLSLWCVDRVQGAAGQRVPDPEVLTESLGSQQRRRAVLG